MRRKQVLVLSLFLFILGIYFLASSQTKISGAVAGSPATSQINSLLAALFIIASVGLLASGRYLIPKKDRNEYIVRSVIGRYKPLVRLAKEAANSQDVQRDINHLEDELYRGNLEPGKGSRHLDDTDGIQELRGRQGGRVYIRRTTNGFEIVGKSSKGRNEDQVCEQLRKLYPKK